MQEELESEIRRHQDENQLPKPNASAVIVACLKRAFDIPENDPEEEKAEQVEQKVEKPKKPPAPEWELNGLYLIKKQPAVEEQKDG